ncbi:MAG: NTP transferase domain-containing protein [Deltaproteobacteria bacterium]|nr:NTP transferase domain-containing protein [Deltaproteobacteria bacterium]MBI3388919.1 NTP transferase domain-containing protein [Deltaproteobacteria bacterium]
MRATELLHVLVLAGGDGTRLQELTRELTGAPIPKQYCRLLGERSLLEETVERARHIVPPARTVVVINHDHLPIVGEQLRGVPPHNIFVQPCGRDTGPGLLFALRQLAQRDRTTIVAMMPSDHYVGDNRAFAAHVEHAAQIVRAHPRKVAVLGIRPDRAEPGLGYIMPSTRVRGVANAFRVAAFQEKPTAESARKLIENGALWNSFVLVFRVDRMLELIEQAAPCETARLRAATESPHDLAAGYRALAPWNFSTQVLARITEHLVAVRVDDIHWSDWGTRESIEQTLHALRRVPPWRTHAQPHAA